MTQQTKKQAETSVQADHTVRAWPRRALSIAASVRDTCGAQWNGTLTDICEQGCKVQVLGAGTLTVGEKFTLLVAGLEAQVACVAWSENSIAGMRFTSLVDSTTIGELLTRWKRPHGGRGSSSTGANPGEPLW